MSIRTKKHSIPLVCLNFKEWTSADAWESCYRDDFDNAAVGAEWTQQANMGSFVEAAGVLTVGVPATTNAALRSSKIDCPVLHQDYLISGCTPLPVRFTTKLNNYAIVENTFAGIMIASLPYLDRRLWVRFTDGAKRPKFYGETLTDAAGVQGDVEDYYQTGGDWGMGTATGYVLLFNRALPANDWSGAGAWVSGSVQGANMFKGQFDTLHDYIYAFGMRYDAGGNTLKAVRNYEELDSDSDDTLDVWLRINIDVDENVTFWYSHDGVTFTQYIHNAVPFTMSLSSIYGSTQGIRVGLLGFQQGVHAGVLAAPFEFFEAERYIERETIEKCYAPIDVRSSTGSYEGRIKSMSPLKRAIDDKTGLFQAADMSLSLINNDMEFSTLLSKYILKNQEAAIYHAWTDEQEVNKSHICTMIVEDYSLKGTLFNIKLKDITKKYFTKKVPTEICTSGDFPNIHPDDEGRNKPEVLGLATLGTAHEHPGAVKAVYVDTGGPPVFRCLAANGTITVRTDEVWVGDAPKATPGDYSITYADGHTYIDLTANPGNATVTFNATGRSLGDWDSINGYIQNPAYVIEYFLRYLMDIPEAMIDGDSFDTLAAYFTGFGAEESCYLILQEEKDAVEVLRQLLFTCDAKGFIAKDGRFKVEHKDTSNWQITSPDSHIITQIDLFGAAEKRWNLIDAVNTIKANYGYIPWQRLFKNAKESYEDNLFEETMEENIRMPKEDLRV